MSEKNYSGSTNVLELKNIVQSYQLKGKPTFNLFENLNFEIEDKPDIGQSIALMGESGCGKSTILRYFTGLQKPTSGEILFCGNKLKPTDTIPMVFQMPSSLEWYSVLDNVALPLRLKGVNQKEAYEKAIEMIKVVGLEGHEYKFAKAPNLSGGQLQRVAIARSLVANPAILMMDEPFSALDSANRTKMQFFLIDLFKKSEMLDLNPTTVIVTHDAKEAVFLASDIYIMGVNPSGIKDHIKVDVKVEDRNEDLRHNKDFLDLVAYVDDAVQKDAK